MHVLVQTVPQGHVSHIGFETSALQFWQRGYEITRFEFEELDRGDFDDMLCNEAETTIVRGGVGTIRTAVERAGRVAPVLPDLPEELLAYVGRRVWKSTLGEFRAEAMSAEFQPPVHIKPLHDHKKFTGVLVDSFRKLIPTARLKDELEILCQEKIHFVSEWRTYVLRSEILQVCCYKGNPLLFPDPVVQRNALIDFQTQPIACSMDWGVTTDGRTVLVEVNDGFSLGNYGLPGHMYTAMIEARWRQLMGLPDNFVGVKLES